MDVDQNSGKTEAQEKGQSTMMPQSDQRGKERPPALDRSSAVKDVHRVPGGRVEKLAG